MRTTKIACTLLGAAGAIVFLTAATPAPTPVANSAGTSFLTAAAIAPDGQAHVSAVTGDYLYWSFAAEAGQRPALSATVQLPPATQRHGAQAWTIEVFDGLRRRQPCVDGAQSPVVAADATDVTLGCRLRQVRSWAEPWDGDPLPGTYYVRISSTTIPENDLGLAVQADLKLNLEKGDTGDDQGVLAAPLVPGNQPGRILTEAPVADASAAPDDSGSHWLPDFSSRWIWTAGGGVLAAVAGLIGFSFTRKRRLA